VALPTLGIIMVFIFRMLNRKQAMQGKIRKRNRWADGLDAPAAGARDFFPPGWVPTRDAFESIEKFGHQPSDLQKLQTKGERMERELRELGMRRTTAQHCSIITAFTEENDIDLYGRLGHACRTAGGVAEMRLRLYLDYLYHLQEAHATLDSFVGRVYRGIKERLNTDSYAPGKTITWQQFSSTSKKQQVAQRFLLRNPSGKKLCGTFFVIDLSSAGKEIAIFSAFPEEEEVLVKYNTFFKVVKKLETEAEKKAELPDLSGYDMADVDAYVLRQL